MREHHKGRKRNGREQNKGNREGDRAETRLMPFPLRGLGRLWRRLGKCKGVERGGGTQREAKLRVFHPESRLPWRVTRYLSFRRIEGEKGRVGEWERDTKRK